MKSSPYETFSVGGHCDAGHIFLYSNRLRHSIHSFSQQSVSMLGTHFYRPLGFSKRQDLVGAPA
jgi:hypothetical protein